MKDLVVLKAHPSSQAYIEHLRVYVKVEIIGTRKGTGVNNNDVDEEE